jgi:aryl-alcohol dehydrogenase-like predicted oxidoreductase
MKTRTIGDVQVSAIGLGGMPMSIEGRPDAARSEATIHAALDEGVTFFDTADAYHLGADEVGHNESLIADAVASWGGDTSAVLIATKGGHLRPGDGSWTVNGRPEYLKEAAKASLARLGGDAIGLYQFHRPDPDVAYEDSIGALRDLLDEGVIRMAGISNANVERIRLSQEILGGRLVSVQNRFARFKRVADERGISPQVVCLAWHLAKSPHVVPIPGASRPESIRDSVGAADVELTAEELAALDAA